MPGSRLTTVDAVLAEHLKLVAEVRSTLGDGIARAADLFCQVLGTGHRILLFGNGGSASDALHIEGELVNRFRRDRPGLPAITLGASLPSLTSTANDYAYEQAFARLLEALGQPGDLAVGITTSGSSPNVIQGLAAGRRLGLETLALTGRHTAAVAPHADLTLAVPSSDTARIQETHILIGHIICRIVEDELFGDRDG